MLAGRRVDTAGAEEIVFDSEYAEDTALLFCSRGDVKEQTPALMEHFAYWGMEVHSDAQGKDSKSKILFCAAPPHIYSDRATCDGADLSDVQLPVGRLICRSCPSTCGAPRLTYGRSMVKAMDFFNLDHARWPELAADRAG